MGDGSEVESGEVEDAGGWMLCPRHTKKTEGAWVGFSCGPTPSCCGGENRVQCSWRVQLVCVAGAAQLVQC